MITNRPTVSLVKKIEDVSDINRCMALVFQDAQMSLSGHRKLVVVLTSLQDRAIALGYEDSFTSGFVKLINKILSLKKGEKVGDRIAKFCSLFIATLNRNEQEEPETQGNKGGRTNDVHIDNRGNDSISDDDDTPASRFVDYILRHLLRGIQAKDKNVRYRVVQLLAYIISHIGEIDEELFKALQWSLNRRLYDKEPGIRLQAVVAISCFQYINFEDEGAMENLSVNKTARALIHSMQNDESAEVRRAAMLNLIKNSTTLPLLLERARDNNSINRRLVYSKILKEIGHFKNLSFDIREQLLNWGLYDRDESVRETCATLLCSTWFDFASNDILSFIESLRVSESLVCDEAMRVFYKSLKNKFSDVEIKPEYFKELTLEKAFLLRTYYQYCNENSYYDLIDQYYPEPIALSETLEKYLNLRKYILNEHEELITKFKGHTDQIHKYDAELETMLLEEHQLVNEETESSRENNKRLAKVKHIKERMKKKFKEKESYISKQDLLIEEYNTFKDELKDLDYIILQLMIISKDYDFSDEIGRRKMLQVIRHSLANDNLSDGLIATSLKVLQKISISDHDFSTMCTEIVTDIRDSYMDENDEDTFHSAIAGFADESSDDERDSQRPLSTSDEASQNTKKRKMEPKQPPDEVVIQSLLITQHLLELTDEPLESNFSLGSLIESLVRPAVLRNEQPYIRSLGMKCLGLFALLDRQLAIDNLYLFGIAATKADENLRIICVKIIIDIISTYGTSVLDIEGGVDSLSLARLFYKILRNFEMPELQCVVAEGLCKLFLADVMSGFGKAGNSSEDSGTNGSEKANDDDQEKQLLETLMLTYFHPINSSNESLRQILAFCIPVYAFSRADHQNNIASISGDCFYRMFREDGEFSKFDNAISPSTVLRQLIHWCDPSNLVNVDEMQTKRSPAPLWQAISFLQAVEQDTPKAIKKCIIVNLNRLHITEHLGSSLLEGLKTAVNDTKSVIESNQHYPDFVLDNTTEKSFDKFLQHVSNLLEKASTNGNYDGNPSLPYVSPSQRSRLNSASVRSSQRAADTPDDHMSNTSAHSAQYLSPLSSPASDHSTREREREKEDANKEDLSLNESLKNIDQLLDEEENVQYDIALDDLEV